MSQPIPTEGTLRTADGEALPLRATDVRARLDGPVADVRVTQRFENDRGAPIEAVYAFPLPAGASVYRLEMRIGDRTVRAVVKEKKEAAAVYAQALREGRAATLLEQDDAELFTMKVANVPAGEGVEVELRYQELLAFDDGEWRFVFPMTTRERYVEVAEETLRRARGPQRDGGARLPAIDAVRPPRRPTGERGPDVRVELDVVGDVSDVRCPSHLVELRERASGGVTVVLAPRTALANRDLVVTARASARGVRPDVRYQRDADGMGTLLLTLVPSSDVTAGEVAGAGVMKALRCANCGATIDDARKVKTLPGLGPIVECEYCCALLAPSTERVASRATRPRDVTILVDRSASMRGSSAQVSAAIRAILGALPETDAARLVAFDHDREAFEGGGFIGVTASLAARAVTWLDAHPPRGGTELERMIERAAESPIREGRTPVIVLITDAAVGNEGRLIRRAKELLGARRLFVLGCGPSPDRRLCARLAREGGGAAEVLAPRETDGDAMARFARKVREGGPILTGLSVAFEGVDVVDVEPRALPDLCGGEPAQLLARYAAPGAGHAVISGLTADGAPFLQRVPLRLPEAATTPGLARLWARRRVDGLLEAAVEEPRRAPARIAEATSLAIAHTIVTPHTSLVAEDDEPVADRPARRVEQAAPMASGGGAMRHASAPAACDEGVMYGGPLGAPCAAPSPLGRGEGSAALDRSTSATMALDLEAVMARPCPAPPPAMSAPLERTAAPKRRVRSAGVVAKVKDMADALFGGRSEAREPLYTAPPRDTAIRDTAIHCDVSYDDDELRWLRERASGELDLVFLVDETGSMGRYIDEVKRRLLALVDALEGLPLCSSLRLGLVTYRDHPPQDHTFASRTFALTDDVASIQLAVEGMCASGGGDGPEAVTDGLADVVRMGWRSNAARVVVWFGDAPPHGVEPSGDGFPEGCPCGDHWYTQAESLREMGTAVYAVGCLPGLRHYVGAEDVFRTVATTTRGLYLPLQRADLLVPLMAAAAATELDRRRVDAHVEAALEAYGPALEETDDAERVRWLRGVLHGAGLRPREMDHAEEAKRAPVLRSRDLTEADVEAAVHRLRLAGRAA